MRLKVYVTISRSFYHLNISFVHCLFFRPLKIWPSKADRRPRNNRSFKGVIFISRIHIRSFFNQINDKFDLMMIICNIGWKIYELVRLFFL